MQRIRFSFSTTRRFLFGLVVLHLLAACGKPPEPVVTVRVVKPFTVGGSLESDPSSGTRVKPTPLARDAASPSFDAAGRVISVLVTEGERVQSGQTLARLDPRDLALAESSAKAQFDAARAELDFAESDFRRYAGLFAKGFISMAELDRRQAALKVARARFEATTEQLGFISLRASEAGVVEAVLVSPGIIVSAGQTAFRLKFSPPAASVSKRQQVAGLQIPTSSLVDGKAVYKILENPDGSRSVQRVEVRLGRVTERFAEVMDGLKAGDQIVAAGVHVLADGEKVKLFTP